MLLKFRGLLFIVLFVLVISGVGWDTPASAASPSPGGVAYIPAFRDDFTESTLHSRWDWVREDASHWSLSALPGYMRITTQTGSILGHYYTNPNNLLLTPAPDVDFFVWTRVNMSPTQNYQFAGLLYYQDDDNYLHLDKVYDDGTVWISFKKEVAGDILGWWYIDTTATSLYLAMRKMDSTFYGLYSFDGLGWYYLGQHDITLTDPMIGVDAANSYGSVPEIPADFDFIEMFLVKDVYLPVIVR